MTFSGSLLFPGTALLNRLKISAKPGGCFRIGKLFQFFDLLLLLLLLLLIKPRNF